MNVGTNMLTTTWNAALAIQDGLVPIVNSWHLFTPEVIDGFQMAQASQLAVFSSSSWHNAMAHKTTDIQEADNTVLLTHMAHACLRLDECANGEDRLRIASIFDDAQKIFREIHGSRMIIPGGWFESYAWMDPEKIAMPSSVQKSLALYWSILLEHPKAMEGVIEATPSLFKYEGRVLAGFKMALAFLVMMLPHCKAGNSAYAIYKEMLAHPGRLLDSNDEGGRAELLSYVRTIAHELGKIGNPLVDAVGELRSPGNEWSVEPKPVERKTEPRRA